MEFVRAGAMASVKSIKLAMVLLAALFSGGEGIRLLPFPFVTGEPSEAKRSSPPEERIRHAESVQATTGTPVVVKQSRETPPGDRSEPGIELSYPIAEASVDGSEASPGPISITKRKSRTTPGRSPPAIFF